ncbi:CYTH-like domain-containing protein [Macrophomina phaseolina]|nr:CYTH-like domain-containing protein [Macrophomina phaseolina]
MLNDDGNLPPATPKTARQASVASIISPTPPSTAASYTSKPSPAPQASPAPPPKSASVSAPRTPREVPPWARRFDWIALQRGEVRQAHIPERPPPPQQLPISQQPISQKPIGQQPIPRQPSAPPPLDSIGGLEPSLTNVQPYDDVVRKVCDFLWSTVVEREDLHGGVPEGAHPNIKLEIEGKLGTLVDRNTNERVNLPILTQAVSALPTTKLGFESHMNEEQHRDLNKFLNKTVQDALRPPRSKIRYEHLRETDSFYVIDESLLASLPPSVRPYIFSGNRMRKPRIRVTRDTNTKEIKAQIIKQRIGDLDIICPGEAFDCRISVNIEVRFNEDIAQFEAADEPPRMKDRMSYQHLHTQVDLTQVRSSNNAKIHELEVELSAERIIEQGIWTKQGRPDACYEEMVKTFVNNIRILSRQATNM